MPTQKQLQLYYFLPASNLFKELMNGDRGRLLISLRGMIHCYLCVMWEEVHQLQSGDEQIMSCCTCGNLLVCGRTDGTISIWDLYHLRERIILRGHSRSVLSVKCGTFPCSGEEGATQENFIFSSSSDNTIKVWNLSTYNCVCTIIDHPGDIYSIALHDNLLCIGCQDTSIKIIDLNFLFTLIAESKSQNTSISVQETKTVTLRAHNGYVFSVCTAPKTSRLISGAGDGMVMLWEINEFLSSTSNRYTIEEAFVPVQEKQRISKAEKIIQTNAGAVYDVIADETFIYVAAQDFTIQIWDLESGLLRRVLSGHSSDVLSITHTQTHLISSSSDGTIRIWNKSNYYCEQIIEAHTKASFSVLTSGAYTDGIFFSCFNNCVKVWALDQTIDEVHESTNANQKRLPSLSRLPSLPVPNNHETSLILSMRDPLVIALRKFVSMKSISGDPKYKDHCFTAAKFLWKLFEQHGFQSQLVPGGDEKNPLVLARIGHNTSIPTVTVYGHYDVFPVKRASWDTEPFTMTGKNGFLYGRGTSDDKGPILAALFAASDLQQAGKLPVNLAFVIEGEEECRSVGAIEALKSNKNYFNGTDVILISNSVWLGENKPCLHYGLRGILKIKVTLSGPKKNLHSGVDGGALNEPMMTLVNLLSGIVDEKGIVHIPGFYDNIKDVSESEQKLYEGVDFDIEAYKESLGVTKLLSDDPKELLMKRWRYPTLSIHAIGNAKNVSTSIIPACVTCQLSIRFVPDQKAEDIFAIVQTELQKRFSVMKTCNSLSIECIGSGDWWLGDLESSYFKAAENSLEKVWSEKVVYSREGGTIPITNRLEQLLGAPAIHLPIGQSSDGHHLPNERLRVENLMRGKEVVTEFFREIAKHSK